jgi:DNA-binding MarR family transcriptional regulator
MEAFFHAYMAFIDKPDEILAKRGLARVHHRILFFVARRPRLSVKELLQALGVSKQAINIPLRQLLEMDLIHSGADAADKRIKRLTLSVSGSELEQSLHREQVRLLERAFAAAGQDAVQAWLKVNQELARSDAG